MKQLFTGAIEFKENNFEHYKELFETLDEGQNPHTLFIGCSDSRVVPNLITSTIPGELFVVRNIANIVPPYKRGGDYAATTAAIEYAVNILGVENIIICGHSNCGGCNALYYEDAKFDSTPNVKKWLELAKPVKKKVLAMEPSEISKRSWLTEQINIELQIEHILTYPTVKEKFENGTLNVLGWYYYIKTGEVYSYDFDSGEFLLIENKINEGK